MKGRKAAEMDGKKKWREIKREKALRRVLGGCLWTVEVVDLFVFVVILKGGCPVDSMYRKVFVLHMPM